MLIKVKTFPGSKKEEIIKKKEDAFEVWVKQKPVRGEANKAVINCLSRFLNVSSDKIRLIKGFKNKNKVFEVFQ